MARSGMASEERPGVWVDSVLTPVLEALVDCIEPMPADPHTCFVAMPFRGAFASYFGRVYTPLAWEPGASPLRMWGGLSGEAYVDLMMAVIRRSGRVIVDLTGPNANVLIEFWVARGLDKPWVVLCQRPSAAALPANVRSDQLLLLYSPRERGWPAQAAGRCALQVRSIDLGIEQQAARLTAAQWSSGASLPDMPPG